MDTNTSRLAIFKDFALRNMMEVERIVCEVYSDHCEGRVDFALFDGGAHKGFHTKHMLALPGCKRVHAVEADPFMAETFKEIMARDATGKTSGLVFHEAALQNDKSCRKIRWRSSETHVGRSSIVSENITRQTIWRGNNEMGYRDDSEVVATTIDTIVDHEELPIPFVKLDLEGADLLALLGATETLRIKRPIVAFENSVHAPEVHGFSLADVATTFFQLDYVPMNFVGERIAADNWFGFFEAWLAPAESADWLSTHLKNALERRGL